jgi:hypothetical protein
LEKGGAIGTCYFNFGGPTKIVIDPDWWETAPPEEHWALIFHELGHCICNRDHPVTDETWFVQFLQYLGWPSTNNYLKDGCEKTLMNPYNVRSYCVNSHKAYYIEELFKECKVITKFIWIPSLGTHHKW